MAETLTYDPTPADAPELNADEQDSLAVGEEMQAAQDDLLAGKYKNAQELENAYMELQRKLGDRSDEPEEIQVVDDSTEIPESVSFLNDASSEWYETGELSQETLEGLSQMTSSELVEAYIESQANQEPAAVSLSDQEVNSIKDQVGGEEQYNTIVTWAGENLDQSAVDGFDALIESGNVKAIEMAVAGLQSMYEAQNGSDGRLVTGKAPRTNGDTFKSQAEVVAAMSDPRYDRDPAYRNEIIEKLDRSENYF